MTTKTSKSEGPYEIGEVAFMDRKVKIYHDKYSTANIAICCWSARNRDSFYQGPMYLDNETGAIAYPEDAVIPEATKSDREIMPKFLITGKNELSEDLVQSINEYLRREHKRRNNITDE